MKAEWKYDVGKRMYYRHFSECHDAAVEQKMLHKGKVAKPDFKLVRTGQEVVDRKVIVRKHLFWKFWYMKLKTVQEEVTSTNVMPVTYRYFCTECSKQCKDNWEYKHGGIDMKIKVTNKSRATKVKVRVA